MVFAEAMASGCPVVATDVGGIADVTGNGEYAALVPQRDAAAIADAVVRLLEEPDTKEICRAHAISVMREKFDHAFVQRSYAGLIERAAA